jgi:hypothetical protein
MVSTQIKQKIEQHYVSKNIHILPEIKVQKDSSLEKPLYELKAASEKLCR